MFLQDTRVSCLDSPSLKTSLLQRRKAVCRPSSKSAFAQDQLHTATLLKVMLFQDTHVQWLISVGTERSGHLCPAQGILKGCSDSREAHWVSWHCPWAGIEVQFLPLSVPASFPSLPQILIPREHSLINI